VIYFQSLSKQDLADLLLPLSKNEKQATYRSKQIYRWVYQRGVDDWELMTDLAKDTRNWLKENVEIFRLKERLSQQALDGTHKFLWDLHDGKTIESVIIPAALQEKDTMDEAEKRRPEGPGARFARAPTDPGARFAGAPADVEVSSERWSRLTACISSQVGCAMACKFCLTGVQGLDRHLQAHEIVTQIHELRRVAPITNIVFMGMGEPLHNLENVIKACEILIDDDGLGFSRRKVTVSTSGLVPGIEELGRRVPVSLAISLNATTDEQRSAIMPVNKKWNLEALLKACRDFPLGSHRRITFEYVLLKGFNDTLEDAARIIKLTRGIPSKINLIPFNEHSGSEFKRPDDATVRKFQVYLLDRGVVATVRISRGRDILAACGQLRSIFGTARGTEKHKDWKPKAEEQGADAGAAS
jgi:23S rRNA (adenine2503-C2)-methyltransferase